MNDLRGPGGRFLPGNPGSPGRPLGSPHVLAEIIKKDVLAEWDRVLPSGERRGPAALAKLTEDQFIRAAAGIVPRELWVTAQRQPSALEAALSNASPEEQALAAECFTLISKLGPRAVELLRSEAAKPVEAHTESPSQSCDDGH